MTKKIFFLIIVSIAFASAIILFDLTSIFKDSEINTPTYYVLDEAQISQIKDLTPIIAQALEECKSKGHAGIKFPKGTYHFYPTYAPDFYTAITNNDNGLKRTPFPLFNFNNFHIDGGGSDFIFHGKMLPFIIEDSNNITVSDLSIDWDMPFFTQGTILENNPVNKTFDVKIETPFLVEDNRIYLTLERENSPYEEEFGHRYAKQEKYHQRLGQNIIWDRSTRAPIYKHGLYSGFDNSFFFPAKALNDSVVRLTSKYKMVPPIGSVFISKGEYLNNRECPGFRVFKSKDLLFKNINVHHSGAMGLIAERSSDITLDSFNVVLREDSNRLITTIADATHFCNCKGLITIKNCTFENMLDDATNIHGTYARVKKIINDNQIAYETYHPHQKDYFFGAKGDSIRIVDKNSLLPKSEILIIEDVKRINEKVSVLSFNKSIREIAEEYDGIDNISWHASAIIENNTVRNNRARGFLISTSRKVEVRNNYISSQMAAMRMSGDLKLWNESGPCDSLIIENNQFVNNLHGGNKQAIILIDPEQHLNKSQVEGYYHKDIIISNNDFYTFDSPILKAESVDGLIFKSNRVIQTDAYSPIFPDEPNIKINHCKNVTLKDNTYKLLTGEYLNLSVETNLN
ncbi:right-handed parallel beta-helix repeat-containing protein [Gaetbulibacter saemankumensis]|uniref:right-handed parallel beta-helix repeat-containing protein n=1 Tax=Gaetbulibacter saemankumensis TaxID=311208 RepID=UPI00041E9689|nr:right-handed parallel beta-helix repeat-containing protein [Gaetbulibacter saemankumensis]